jgi:hypothetical protein
LYLLDRPLSRAMTVRGTGDANRRTVASAKAQYALSAVPKKS